MQVERPTTKLLGANMFYVYVLQSEQNSDKFYLGYSSDLKKRLQQHNEGQNKSTAFSSWKLVYYEAYTNKQFAHNREQKLKKNSRMRKLLMDRIKQSLS